MLLARDSCLLERLRQLLALEQIQQQHPGNRRFIRRDAQVFLQQVDRQVGVPVSHEDFDFVHHAVVNFHAIPCRPILVQPLGRDGRMNWSQRRRWFGGFCDSQRNILLGRRLHFDVFGKCFQVPGRLFFPERNRPQIRFAEMKSGLCACGASATRAARRQSAGQGRQARTTTDCHSRRQVWARDDRLSLAGSLIQFCIAPLQVGQLLLQVIQLAVQ